MNDLVGPWVRRFLVEYVMGERNYSPNTQHSYRDTFRLLLPLAAKQCRCTVENLTVSGIKPKLLREFTHYLEQVRHCRPSTQPREIPRPDSPIGRVRRVACGGEANWDTGMRLSIRFGSSGRGQRLEPGPARSLTVYELLRLM